MIKNKKNLKDKNNFFKNYKKIKLFIKMILIMNQIIKI